MYALLGAMMGLAATAFIRLLSAAEDGFDRIRNPYWRHVAGIPIVGLLIYALLRTTDVAGAMKLTNTGILFDGALTKRRTELGHPRT
jgi:H+/Cl- antiporter ClcA